MAPARHMHILCRGVSGIVKLGMLQRTFREVENRRSKEAKERVR